MRMMTASLAMAAAFADCDEHLILESMNEPRLTDTVYEWNFSESSPECRDAAACECCAAV